MIILLWFAVNFVMSYVCAVPSKNSLSCILDQLLILAIDIAFLSVMNIGYQKNIKIGIGTPLPLNSGHSYFVKISSSLNI